MNVLKLSVAIYHASTALKYFWMEHCILDIGMHKFKA